MNFDSSLAWDRAVAWIRANMATLTPLAGLFLLIPTLIVTWFTTDLQMTIQASAASAAPGKFPPGLLGQVGQLFAIMIGLSFVQSIGTMAMLTLFSDRGRPTVGEAIARAIRCLPTVIGMTLILMLAFVVAGLLLALIVGVVVGVLAAVIGAGAAGLVAVLFGGGMLAGVMLVAVRFSMATPAVVIEGVTSPVAALGRSWALTREHAWKLLGFFLLLGIAYLVIALALGAVIGLIFGFSALGGTEAMSTAGTLPRIADGLVSGMLGAAAGVVSAGVIGAVHEQLAGPSPETMSMTFE